MSHMLELTETGEGKMCYFGETPWHSLGKAITNEDAMYDDRLFMTEAMLDWEAEKRQLSRQVADGYAPAQAWEVVRTSDQKVLADMVGASLYHPAEPRRFCVVPSFPGKQGSFLAYRWCIVRWFPYLDSS